MCSSDDIEDRHFFRLWNGYLLAQAYSKERSKLKHQHNIIGNSITCQGA